MNRPHFIQPGKRLSWGLTALWLWTVGCGDTTEWDGVVEVEYSRRAVGQVKRRIDLIRGGVRLRNKLKIEKSWQNAMGYTFIARFAPDQGEGRIVKMGAKREGIPVKEKTYGIAISRLGAYALEPGYWLVDVFSGRDEYIGSAVVRQDMPGRTVLRHLGLLRWVTATTDRFAMTPDEQIHWREFLPVVLQNNGYGYIYLKPPDEGTGTNADSSFYRGQRYEIDRFEPYVLVGRTQGNERSRHIFTVGQAYVLSALYAASDSTEEATRRILATLGLDVIVKDTEAAIEENEHSH